MNINWKEFRMVCMLNFSSYGLQYIPLIFQDPNFFCCLAEVEHCLLHDKCSKKSFRQTFWEKKPFFLIAASLCTLYYYFLVAVYSNSTQDVVNPLLYQGFIEETVELLELDQPQFSVSLFTQLFQILTA